MSNNSLDFKIFHSISEVDPANWDQLSAGRPFTSHQWYRYGETVMAGALPTYLIIYNQGEPIARATFWRMVNEPIMTEPEIIKKSIQLIMKRWPLLICRSPLSGLSGLILPEPPLRNDVQALLSLQAREISKQTGSSFLIFDYLHKEDCSGWVGNFTSVAEPNPGTIMHLTWPSFEDYLQAGNKKDRQHYKKTLREAEKLNIKVTRHKQAYNIDKALALIHGTERRFGSAENIWAQAMLENLSMAQDATFLTAEISDEMVGCGLILEDNGAQMNTILGLADNVLYVYFTLIYESLKIAFERHIKLLRLGSGAYEVKRQLGFSLEENNFIVFQAQNQLLQIISRYAS